MSVNDDEVQEQLDDSRSQLVLTYGCCSFFNKQEGVIEEEFTSSPFSLCIHHSDPSKGHFDSTCDALKAYMRHPGNMRYIVAYLPLATLFFFLGTLVHTQCLAVHRKTRHTIIFCCTLCSYS